MCGIAGIIDLHHRPVAASKLQKMTNALYHRGPDGEGFFIHENVGFGHRRLAIIDLTIAGQQPMHYKGLSITYNGEIYNYIELRQELEKAGMVLYTQTDTEVILAAYHVWGKDCITHFNGMWSFAIFDAAKQLVFCSRDRFGEKPFYYRQADGCFYFASEIRALKAVASKCIAPNDMMSARFLVFEQAEHFTETFYQGIYKLPAAHNLIIHLNNGHMEQEQYYSPKRTTAWHQIQEEAAIEELRSKLRQSVALRLRSDVAVGTCLSGGLDSSAIAAFAASMFHQEVQQSFTGITAGSCDAQKDETHFAQMVAASLNMAWQHVTPAPQDYAAACNRVLSIQEEPFDSSSVIMQHFVMQLAQHAGLKVLLDGQGADELLLGYLPHLAWAIKALPPLAGAKLAWQSLENYRLGLKDMLMLLTYHTHTTRKKNRQLLRWAGMCKNLKEQLQEEAAAEAKLPGDLFSRQCYELSHRILPMLLRYEDKNAMAFSIETRLPFLDPELVEFLLNIDTVLKVNNGWSKFLLRKTVETQLPLSIAWRKGKIGFDGGNIKGPWSNNVDATIWQWKQGHANRKPTSMPHAILWRMHLMTAWKQQQSEVQ